MDVWWCLTLKEHRAHVSMQLLIEIVQLSSLRHCIVLAKDLVCHVLGCCRSCVHFSSLVRTNSLTVFTSLTSYTSASSPLVSPYFTPTHHTMIASKATQAAKATVSRATFKAPVLRSVRARVSTQEDTQTDAAAPPKVDFMPNTQAVSCCFGVPRLIAWSVA